MCIRDSSSDDWYLGSISNEKGRELRISLSFLDSDKKYNATVYRDPESGGWKKRPEEVVIENRYVTSKTELEIVLPPGGGQAIRFSPEG